MTFDLETQEGVNPLRSVVYKLDQAILRDAIGGFSYISADEFSHDDQYFKLGRQHTASKEVGELLAKIRNLPPHALAKLQAHGVDEKALEGQLQAALEYGDYSKVNIEGLTQLVEELVADSKNADAILDSLSYMTPEEKIRFCYEEIEKHNKETADIIDWAVENHIVDKDDDVVTAWQKNRAILQSDETKRDPEKYAAVKTEMDAEATIIADRLRQKGYGDKANQITSDVKQDADLVARLKAAESSKKEENGAAAKIHKVAQELKSGMTYDDLSADDKAVYDTYVKEQAAKKAAASTATADPNTTTRMAYADVKENGSPVVVNQATAAQGQRTGLA